MADGRTFMNSGTGSAGRHCEGETPKGVDADGSKAAIVAVSPWFCCLQVCSWLAAPL